MDGLGKAAERRFLGLMQIKLDPILHSLRNESQVIAVLERVNLRPTATPSTQTQPTAQDLRRDRVSHNSPSGPRSSQNC